MSRSLRPWEAGKTPYQFFCGDTDGVFHVERNLLKSRKPMRESSRSAGTVSRVLLLRGALAIKSESAFPRSYRQG